MNPRSTTATAARANASVEARADTGLVLIGRNEGERLRRALRAAHGRFATAVYVDSNSSDDSVVFARSMGIDVVELDLSIPFTAARGRNAGFARALELHPELVYVQFVDGDCEIDPEWLPRAITALEGDAKLAAVCGRRRERAPDASIYNLLCDLEWDTPLGSDTDCGGDALFRAAAFRAVDGFDASLIAGEEPDLCTRLRAAGWRVARIDAEMTRHDAAMTRFGQWWKRAVRTGHTAADSWAREGSTLGARHRRHVASSVFWAACVPLALLAVVLAPSNLLGWSAKSAVIALGLAAYVVLYLRIVAHRRRRGDTPRASRIYAAFCLLGKWPELQGAWIFLRHRVLHRRARLIEYKDAPTATVEGPR